VTEIATTEPPIVSGVPPKVPSDANVIPVGSEPPISV